VRAEKFAPFLLDGVTGSGKTETYFEPMAEAIRMGRQVLVLLPEIALTENFLKRFEQRFGVAPVLWHSSLKSTERRRAWRAISEGGAQVVVGARSALFLPYARLGLIVVDEAHEVSFKQDDGVRYNARDVSVMRARFEGFPVVLASATPALESLQMAESGIYEKLDLPSRFGGAELPHIDTIDLTEEKPGAGRWLAPRLVQALEDRLAKGEQSLLFLNRRGFAPLTLCRNCGFRFKCPNCSAWLVEHPASAPDANDRYLLYQTLFGSWPLEPAAEVERLLVVEDQPAPVPYLEKHVRLERLIVKPVRHACTPVIG
jgi:primosomal protein N' (replication factor Y)